MSKIENIQVIELEGKSPEEVAAVLGEIITGQIRQNSEREKLVKRIASEMTLATCELHVKLIQIAEKYGLEVKNLVFDTISTLLQMIRTWDEDCEKFTEENARDLEELRKMVGDETGE